MNNHIKKALLNGRLVLLFGAGASKECKNSLNDDIPLGGQLAKILADEMGDTYSDEDLSDVYAAAKMMLGEQVGKIFERHFKHCKPSPALQEILKYPFFRIYTLNIDDAFEKAAYSNESRKFHITQRNDRVVEPDQFFENLQYIKLNGDINRIEDGFIFSAQEYGAGSTYEPLWYSELSRDFHRYTFMFIGTKLKEPLFYHQIEKYKSKTGSTDLKSYILIPSLTDIQKRSLESSNIHYLQGKLSDFTDWLIKEFPTKPTSKDIIRNTRPELSVEGDRDSKNINLFDGVTPVNRVTLGLIDTVLQKSNIRNFYKGFKPTWLDIMDEVPALFSKVSTFYNTTLSGSNPKPSDLYLIFGAAGCGKTTALKQLSLKLSDEGQRNVYYIQEYKDNFTDLIHELDYRNSQSYYVLIERLGDLASDISNIIKGSKSCKAIFIGAENQKIWTTRVSEHLKAYIKESIDISHIENSDADLILDKIEIYGNWTRLSKMSKKNRRLELLSKAKKQLLIGLLETISGEGYNKIIQNDYQGITCNSEKALLILAGLATTQRVPANDATLTRALSYLGLNPNVHYLSSNMDGIVQYNNGNVTTRHRVYIELLFKMYIPKAELLKVMKAYLRSFSVYQFPLARSIKRNEFTIYKHLVNAKSLRRIFNDDKESVLSIYEEFEKIFEHEGLFLMQYGLSLRSFGENDQAYEKLRIAQQAFPESPHIEHALAQQRIILACKEKDEVLAVALFSEAEGVLNRLNSSTALSNANSFDRYPIITLSEGHVKMLDSLGQISNAKIIAKQYYDRIKSNPIFSSNFRIQQTTEKLMIYYVSGKWTERYDNEEG